MPDSALGKPLDIDRRAGLSKEEFAAEYESRRPVIVTDALERWPARTKWTFEFFERAYGNDTVFPLAGLGPPTATKVTRLADFIEYVHAPGRDLRGFWFDPAAQRPVPHPVAAVESPFYFFGERMFRDHPELGDDLEPGFYFVDDWSRSLAPHLRDLFQRVAGREYRVLLIGPAGTIARVHRDYGQTHSCLAQLAGRKHCTLFAPEHAECLYDGAVDPDRPDLERFPRFRDAIPFAGVIDAGDTLYTPPGWWHGVRALDKSITVAHNFFNGSNLSAYLAFLLRRLPALVDWLDANPAWRAELGVRWSLDDFRKPGPVIAPDRDDGQSL